MFELQVALEELKGLPRLFENFTRQQVHRADEDCFPNITRLIAQLESNMPGLKPPPLPSKDYRLQWEAYCAGNIAEIDKMAIKWLCWQRDIVRDQRFAEYLLRNVAIARARLIKGLVWSLHLNWAQNWSDKDITEYTTQQLASYTGTDRVLVKWRSDIITIIGERGPSNFAKKNLLKENKSPKDASKEWALYEFSEYMYSAVVYTVDACIDDLVNSPDVIDYLFDKLLGWPGWDTDRSSFDCAVMKLILHPDISGIKQRLISALLRHPLLGDPRLPANRNKWAGFETSTVRQFIIWLSAKDINFFFDYVLKGQDRHGRRTFWLNYVNNKLLVCRPLLSDVVADQLEGNNDVSYGRLSGTQNRAAFILDFGRIVAVEFSDAGKGCVYLFQREEFDKSTPDLWSSAHIPEYLLKNQLLPRDRRVPHSGFWEEKVANILAINGIRP